ncbi:MAG: UDP-3-O-(3-hydroxymyristoyl)glucosamine N-acyltransferase, partial [Dehalococcoidia bacterium]|nr:UDP-3-O-(3-hydroxymyristoyl)glucosamine N-acyltransferase [Dehalococcoidia bacterium]
DELLNSIGEAVKVLGKKDRYVSVPSPIDKTSSESVTFCNQKAPKGLQMVRSSKAGVVICYDDLQFTGDDFKDKTLILVSNPRLAFMRILRKYFVEEERQQGISPRAVVDEAAKIHPSVYIGPNSYIGKCEIGENTVIDGNVYIYPRAVIGRNVVIHAGTVIGAEGFGYERNDKRKWEKFPQIGWVVIEDDVDIGSNTSIDRGTLDKTIIKQGTKINNLCMIGHNVVIGKNCIIGAHSYIGGSGRIGDDSWLAPGAIVRNGVNVGSNTIIGMGSVVTKNVGDGKVVFGVPAKEQGENQ